MCVCVCVCVCTFCCISHNESSVGGHEYFENFKNSTFRARRHKVYRRDHQTLYVQEPQSRRIS